MRLVSNRYNIDNSYPKELFSKLRENYPDDTFANINYIDAITGYNDVPSLHEIPSIVCLSITPYTFELVERAILPGARSDHEIELFVEEMDYWREECE